MKDFALEISNLETIDDIEEYRDYLSHLLTSKYITWDEYSNLIEDLNIECGDKIGRPLPSIDDDDWEEMKKFNPDLSDQ